MATPTNGYSRLLQNSTIVPQIIDFQSLNSEQMAVNDLQRAHTLAVASENQRVVDCAAAAAGRTYNTIVTPKTLNTTWAGLIVGGAIAGGVLGAPLGPLAILTAGLGAILGFGGGIVSVMAVTSAGVAGSIVALPVGAIYGIWSRKPNKEIFRQEVFKELLKDTPYQDVHCQLSGRFIIVPAIANTSENGSQLFELSVLEPYVKRKGVHPITGETMSEKDILPVLGIYRLVERRLEAMIAEVSPQMDQEFLDQLIALHKEVKTSLDKAQREELKRLGKIRNQKIATYKVKEGWWNKFISPLGPWVYRYNQLDEGIELSESVSGFYTGRVCWLILNGSINPQSLECAAKVFEFIQQKNQEKVTQFIAHTIAYGLMNAERDEIEVIANLALPENSLISVESLRDGIMQTDELAILVVAYELSTRNSPEILKMATFAVQDPEGLDEMLGKMTTLSFDQKLEQISAAIALIT